MRGHILKFISIMNKGWYLKRDRAINTGYGETVICFIVWISVKWRFKHVISWEHLKLLVTFSYKQIGDMFSDLRLSMTFMKYNRLELFILHDFVLFQGHGSS
jgi:hypothetical protein